MMINYSRNVKSYIHKMTLYNTLIVFCLKWELLLPFSVVSSNDTFVLTAIYWPSCNVVGSIFSSLFIHIDTCLVVYVMT